VTHEEEGEWAGEEGARLAMFGERYRERAVKK
jgi:hypothetical protein